MSSVKRRDVNKRRYIVVFLITTAIFITGMLISNQLNNAKVNNIKQIEDNIYIDTLSAETQFALLEDSGCSGLTEKTVLSSELKNIGKKLNFMESTLGISNNEVILLKKRYTLLQIKDYLLMKKLSKKCDLSPINILYFYSNNEKFTDESTKQGYVLTRLSNDNPRLRIYSFDYDLKLPLLKTLISVKNVKNQLPVIVIEDHTYSGFQSLDKIKKLLPTLDIIKERALKHLDGTDSTVFIQCAQDIDCKKTDDIISICKNRQFSIRADTKKEDIEGFNKIESDLIKNKREDCSFLNTDKNIDAVCDKDRNTCILK